MLGLSLLHRKCGDIDKQMNKFRNTFTPQTWLMCKDMILSIYYKSVVRYFSKYFSLIADET